MVGKYRIRMLCYDEGKDPYWDDPCEIKIFGEAKALKETLLMAEYERDMIMSLSHPRGEIIIQKAVDGCCVCCMKNGETVPITAYVIVPAFQVMSA